MNLLPSFFKIFYLLFILAVLDLRCSLRASLAVACQLRCIMCDLTSLTRDQMQAPCIGTQSLSHGTAREVSPTKLLAREMDDHLLIDSHALQTSKSPCQTDFALGKEDFITPLTDKESEAGEGEETGSWDSSAPSTACDTELRCAGHGSLLLQGFYSTLSGSSKKRAKCSNHSPI